MGVMGTYIDLRVNLYTMIKFMNTFGLIIGFVFQCQLREHTYVALIMP